MSEKNKNKTVNNVYIPKIFKQRTFLLPCEMKICTSPSKSNLNNKKININKNKHNESK